MYDITNETPTSKVLLENKVLEKKVSHIAFNGDGTKIILVYGVEKPILWNIENQNNIIHKVLSGPFGSVKSVAFSPDGKNVVIGYSKFGAYNCALWDISNPNAPTYQILQVSSKNHIEDVIFSPDGTKIVLVDDAGKLILFPLVTDKEQLLLEGLKNYTLDQIKLIYDLCLKIAQVKSIALKQLDKKQNEIFNSLPSEMQKLLKDVLLTQSWFFGWW